MQAAAKPEVFLAFFGGLGDGPGPFHSQIVESVAKAGFADPAQIGLGDMTISPASIYLAWTTAAFGSNKAVDALQRADPKTPLVIVGHSYGAQAAIKTIRKLNRQVRHLVTIDGVSRLSKYTLATKPTNVRFWTNVYVRGIRRYGDVIARIGGHWKARRGADVNIDAIAVGKESGLVVSHASFLSMWQMALPYVRQNLASPCH